MTARTLLRGGHVLTMDPDLGDLDRGDVLVEDGRIAAVGRQVDSDAEVVDATGMVVMPGLVDAHAHLWQSPVRGYGAHCWGSDYFATIHPLSQHVRPEDLAAGTRAGALERLANGVTTVVDFCHTVHTPEHPDAAVDALRSVGVRALFGYSLRDRPELVDRTLRSAEDRMTDARRLVGAGAFAGSRVDLAIACNNLEHVEPEQNGREIGLARELGVLATIHSILPGQVRALHERSLLGPGLQLVHATAVSDAELSVLAGEGGSLAITPQAEAQTLAVWPVTGRALAAGVPVGLGVDVHSAVSGSMIDQARTALVLEHLLTAQNRRVQGHAPVRDGGEEPLSPRRALELATSEAARSVGLGRVTGSLTVGKQADVLVLSMPGFARPGGGDVAAHVVTQAGRADVHTVMVGGDVLVSDGRLVDVDERALAAEVEAARDHMLGGAARTPRT